MTARPTIVPIEPMPPFEALWREFPQIENSTMVFRTEWADQTGGAVSRTFRLLDGSYVTIVSTEEGNVLKPADPNDAEIFEAAWKNLGQRALRGAPHRPTGIMRTSHEYGELVVEMLSF